MTIRTGSRLHFGLLAPWAGSPRRHGGVGMMVRDPGIEITAGHARGKIVEGAFRDRILRIAFGLRDLYGLAPTDGFHMKVRSTAREHVGLGTGTQLALAVARVLGDLHGRPRLAAPELARATGRGLRSGIGIHGFDGGGPIVDGGHGGGAGPPTAPLLARLEVPEEWGVLLVLPAAAEGLSGSRESDAFEILDHRDGALEERRRRSADLCHEILLALLPALAEGDFDTFSRALGELQRKVGELFAEVQGGIFASPEVEAVVEHLRRKGVEGVGQSSWGPTVFALVADRDEAEALGETVRERFRLPPGSIVVTGPLNRGAGELDRTSIETSLRNRAPR